MQFIEDASGKFHYAAKKYIPPRKSSRSRHFIPAFKYDTALFIPPIFHFPPFYHRHQIFCRPFITASKKLPAPLYSAQNWS